MKRLLASHHSALVVLVSTVLISPLLASGCGTDEPIEGVDQTVSGDSGPSTEDDDDDFLPDDDDVAADDDTAPIGRPDPTTAPTTTPTPVLTSNLQRACDDDADCGEGLTCMTSTGDAFLGGGPANGMCTAACTADIDCLAIDSNGLCLQLTDTEAYCLSSCTPGDDVLSGVKCGGRQDMACQDFGGAGLCLPTCGTDADCPSDRLCDLGLGACVDELLDGAPVGGACDPTGDSTDCESLFCLRFSETYGACTGACRTGTVGCGSGDATPEDPSEPICLPMLDGVGPDGDVGQCMQRCNCDLDCSHPDAKCFGPVDDADGLAIFGTLGICWDGTAPVDDPTLRLGIECEDGREPPNMSVDSGAGDSGTLDSGPSSPPVTDPDSGEPEPMMSMPDAAADGG